MPLYSRMKLQQDLDVCDKAEQLISVQVANHEINGFQAQMLQAALDKHRKSLKFRVMRVANAMEAYETAKVKFGEQHEETNRAFAFMLMHRYCEICGHFWQHVKGGPLFTKVCVACGAPLASLPKAATVEEAYTPVMRRVTEAEAAIIEANEFPITRMIRNGEVRNYVWLR